MCCVVSGDVYIYDGAYDDIYGEGFGAICAVVYNVVSGDVYMMVPKCL